MSESPMMLPGIKTSGPAILPVFDMLIVDNTALQQLHHIPILLHIQPAAHATECTAHAFTSFTSRTYGTVQPPTKQLWPVVHMLFVWDGASKNRCRITQTQR